MSIALALSLYALLVYMFLKKGIIRIPLGNFTKPNVGYNKILVGISALINNLFFAKTVLESIKWFPPPTPRVVKSVTALENITLYSEFGSCTTNFPTLNIRVFDSGLEPNRKSVNITFRPIKINKSIKKGLKKAVDKLKKNFINKATPKINKIAPSTGEENKIIANSKLQKGILPDYSINFMNFINFLTFFIHFYKSQ